MWRGFLWRQCIVKETKSLIIEQIEWQYQKSTDSHSQQALMKSRIKWMKVRCKNCNHKWKAKDSYEIGSFYEVANDVILDCPQCGATHRIPEEQLD
jgi:RNase P subunit RPR2